MCLASADSPGTAAWLAPSGRPAAARSRQKGTYDERRLRITPRMEALSDIAGDVDVTVEVLAKDPSATS